MIEPAMVKIVGGHPRGDRDQPRRMFSSSEELRSSLVRKAVHADFAIAGWMLNQPRECVETVGRFVAERINWPFRVASSTNILDDHVIAGSSKPDWVRIDDGRRNVAPIRLPHEKRRGSNDLRSELYRHACDRELSVPVGPRFHNRSEFPKISLWVMGLKCGHRQQSVCHFSGHGRLPLLPLILD